jgi:hypothetical protein
MTASSKLLGFFNVWKPFYVLVLYLLGEIKDASSYTEYSLLVRQLKGGTDKEVS